MVCREYHRSARVKYVRFCYSERKMLKGRQHDATLHAILRAKAKLQHLVTTEIFACNAAQNNFIEFRMATLD